MNQLDLIKKAHIEEPEIEDVIELLKVSTNQVFFTFRDKVFTANGLSMGSGLSPILADYFMDSIENKILNGENKITEKVGLWYRMVDDILCLWEGNETELEEFLEMMNNVDENIKYG